MLDLEKTKKKHVLMFEYVQSCVEKPKSSGVSCNVC